jgi:tetratricopeptide (TPR) repeat protein
VALYNLLAENPNNISLRDSLALIYFEQQQYASAALVAQQVVEVMPNDMFAVEIAAICFETLGVPSKALKYYQKLYLNNTDNIELLYQMTFLQIELGLNEEAMASAETLSNHPRSEESTLIFPTESGGGQEVNMKLAAIRLKGIIEEERGNSDKAKEFYANVLSQMPDFYVVQTQLDELNQ